ncbi:MAG: amidohydrolase family protein [Phycisphaerales bacterium]
MKLIHAAVVIDADRVAAAPGALLLDGDCVVAAGSPDSIGNVEHAEPIDLHDCIIIPATVNVHAHLDLTHIGPQPPLQDFIAWIDMIRSLRNRDDAAIARSVTAGVHAARAGGTALIGDIAGDWSRVPEVAMREADMPGISFMEIFGNGRSEHAAIERLRAFMHDSVLDPGSLVRPGIQPHAPYSCSRRVYHAAVATGLPLATHLAETPAELDFIANATGPFAQLLERLGVMDESIQAAAMHPVAVLHDVLQDQAVIAAHVNYVDDAALAQLAHWQQLTVAYCPRASHYFGHANHRYHDMIARGINVAIGSDSIVCLDTPGRISVIDDMAALYQRDGVDARLLLAMATVNGARALGANGDAFRFTPGPIAGVLALPCTQVDVHRDPLAAALAEFTATSSIEWIAGPFNHTVWNAE